MTSLLPAARKIVQSIGIGSPTCHTWKMLKAEFEGHTTFSLVQNLEVVFHKRYDVKTRATAIITEHEDHFRRLEAGGLKFHEHVKIYALIKALPSYYHSFRNNMTSQGLEGMSYKTIRERLITSQESSTIFERGETERTRELKDQHRGVMQRQATLPVEKGNVSIAVEMVIL